MYVSYYPRLSIQLGAHDPQLQQLNTRLNSVPLRNMTDPKRADFRPLINVAYGVVAIVVWEVIEAIILSRRIDQAGGSERQWRSCSLFQAPRKIKAGDVDIIQVSQAMYSTNDACSVYYAVMPRTC